MVLVCFDVVRSFVTRRYDVNAMLYFLQEEDLVVIDKCEDKVEPTPYTELDPKNMKVCNGQLTSYMQ